MTPIEATQHVYGVVEAGVLGVAIDLQHEQFDPPIDQPWIRVTIRDLPAIAVTHGPPGARRKRCRMVVIAQVFAPNFPTDGVAQALTLAQQFKALFEGRDIPSTPGVDPIGFDDGFVRRVGSDGAWFQVNVELAASFDEVF
jgi:hypothetical protein